MRNDEYNTKLIKMDTQQIGSELVQDKVVPHLFVCCGNDIAEYELVGKMTVGRPIPGEIPDIPIPDSHVSHRHGWFEPLSDGSSMVYVSEKTANGVLMNGNELWPDGHTFLKDGDEIIIPASDTRDGMDIMMVYADTQGRVNIWEGMRRASIDKLTELGGRDAFIGWWKRSCLKPEWSHAALFYMDVDRLSEINKTHGNQVGDLVLKVIADELLSAIGDAEQVCRWSEDSFVGVLSGELDDVGRSLFSLKSNIALKSIDGVFVTVSIGFVSVGDFEQDIMDCEAIVTAAFAAMKAVKDSGRNGVRRWTPEDNS